MGKYGYIPKDVEDLIAMFIGTHSITNDPLYMAPGTDVENVVSFKLVPIVKSDAYSFDGIQSNELDAVCVTNIQSAEEVQVKIKEDLIIFYFCLLS